ncbi:MAG: Na+/H+ antiporter NhaC family protein [Clostridia bacterium]|nr:Na+/H+ antiporter NhaC family protein [Clostridia bacterium]
MAGTAWALLPPVIAIVLALITKEVYVSLFVGIISGALFFTNFNVIGSLETTFGLMSSKVGDNTNIIIFLIFLGMLVSLMSKSGASKAYGDWAAKSIKSKRGALAATSALGALIFVDDYFNCLTVGTVMSPVTDKHNITRAKLAYIIDATAAPVCIIAPISSWAAAVGSSMPEGSNIDGFNLFLQTIPANLYAILTIIMIIVIIALNFDFGPMKKYNASHPEGGDVLNKTDDSEIKSNGKVFDLVLPIIVLIVLCVAAMLYTGGILEGANIVDAFANCSSSLALVLGSFFTIIFVFLLYIPRKVITPGEFAESLVSGFKAMVPAILILTLAWTLGGICDADYLNAGGFVGGFVESNQISLAILPAVFFLVSLGLAFATGTSWGTFGILIPICVSVFGGTTSQLMVMTVAAILAGAVCGDHVSPISDTTILASTGANCNHLDHVSTQMPYALIVAGCCFTGYLVGGFTSNLWLALVTGIVLLLAVLFVSYMISSKKKAA